MEDGVDGDLAMLHVVVVTTSAPVPAQGLQLKVFPAADQLWRLATRTLAQRLAPMEEK